MIPGGLDVVLETEPLAHLLPLPHVPEREVARSHVAVLFEHVIAPKADLQRALPHHLQAHAVQDLVNRNLR